MMESRGQKFVPSLGLTKLGGNSRTLQFLRKAVQLLSA
jgi:hypothetical protein